MISTSAGQLVLTSLRDEDRAPVQARPGPARLMREVFAVAVRRCFAGRDPRDVTPYVRGLLQRRDVRTDGVTARELEAVIRSVLGDADLVAGIPDERRVGMMIMVVGDLAQGAVADGAINDAELLEALVAQAETRVARFDPPADGRPWRRSAVR
ncbi:hypothetical protein AB0M54_01790 [Actinoplanes sp. NPDC051470]|uniref:hypothetical protein n=1 Tax=unclassified Actinoplanes TaxID=2626549 RepID=UPI003436C9F9